MKCQRCGEEVGIIQYCRECFYAVKREEAEKANQKNETRPWWEK